MSGQTGIEPVRFKGLGPPQLASLSSTRLSYWPFEVVSLKLFADNTISL